MTNGFAVVVASGSVVEGEAVVVVVVVDEVVVAVVDDAAKVVGDAVGNGGWLMLAQRASQNFRRPLWTSHQPSVSR